jgi:hypothetical protein
MIDDVFSVTSDTSDEMGGEAVLERQAHEVQAGHRSDPPGMARDARLIKPNRKIDPTEIGTEPGRPDNR